MSLSRWGVQGDPRLASWRHLIEVLEKQLRGQRRYLGDTFMFISSLVQGDEARGAHENWRWAVEPEEWDPLHAGRPHFRELESMTLFDTEKLGGLGIEPAPMLLDARIHTSGRADGHVGRRARRSARAHLRRSAATAPVVVGESAGWSGKERWQVWRNDFTRRGRTRARGGAGVESARAARPRRWLRWPQLDKCLLTALLTPFTR